MRFILSALILILCSNVSATEFGERITLEEGMGNISGTINTSLIALLGNPQRWDEEIVSVSGFIRSDLHGVILFVSSEYCERFDAQYGALIVLDDITPEIRWTDLPSNRCSYAFVEGQFAHFPKEAPEPNTIVIRDRPGAIYAKFIYVE